MKNPPPEPSAEPRAPAEDGNKRLAELEGDNTRLR